MNQISQKWVLNMFFSLIKTIPTLIAFFRRLRFHSLYANLCVISQSLHGQANLMRPWQTFQACLQLKWLFLSLWRVGQTINNQKMLGRICIKAKFNHTACADQVAIKFCSCCVQQQFCTDTFKWKFLHWAYCCFPVSVFLFLFSLCYYCIWGWSSCATLSFTEIKLF